MKAIDFTARLFAAIHKTSLTHLHVGYLMSLAAGLSTASEVAEFFGMPNSGPVSQAFKKLIKEGYVSSEIDTLSGEALYSLTEKGKLSIGEILSFLPKK